MPNYFLAKTDPETFSIDDFAKEGITNWDGVHNYAALLVIKAWKIGDLVLIYHSQGESSIAGLAEVITEPIKDPNDSRGISWCAKLKYIRTYPFEKRITLKQVKQSGLFNDFALVKQSRLSTMACPAEFIDYLEQYELKISRED